MSRRLAILIAALLVIAAVVVIFLFRREDEPETVIAERGSLDVSIQTVGSIVAAREEVLRASQSGVIDSVAVNPGDTVDPNDIVVLLERESFEAQITDAERAVEDAEFALQLAEQNDPEAAGAVAASREIFNARRQLEQAHAALENAEMSLREVVVRAPAPGIVVEVLVRDGDLVTAGQPVTRLYQRSDLQLVARVDELGLPSVEIGAPVTFWLDSFPERELEGTVVRTAPAAQQEAGVAFFSTVVGFDVPEGLDIRPGMNAEVHITTELRENVLLIPERAIQSVGERAFVRVLEGGDEREVEIQLGRRGNGMVEVVDGLREGDRVVIE